ncbi:hypothetical protein [Brevibacillus fulvus]|uniref:Uncharacterized protein n=1 Tax=Brevibacillus fulvus TaxID=1125967 RepID=A0A938Y596_9BACL|nr:hypothetical protein [Brevibacillus fulvus]MBM7592176.1 hypothetical protein [Brevibacillus fulvus]
MVDQYNGCPANLAALQIGLDADFLFDLCNLDNSQLYLEDHFFLFCSFYQMGSKNREKIQQAAERNLDIRKEMVSMEKATVTKVACL